ncbi:MAG: dienelactone hydrolase family protein [Cyanobacteria bacterium P01_A01_bin.123]
MRKFLILAISVLLATLVWTACGQNPSATSNDAPASATQGDEILAQHSDDRPIASPAVAIAPSQPVDSEAVTYGEQDGVPLQGYLARPQGASGDLPGLIVIHEWWGLNDNIEKMTERLAGEGYTALAVDLYGGEVAEAPDAARSLVQGVSADAAKAEDNLLQAFSYLEMEQGAEAIGSIGWCFGGGWSLNTALLLPDELDAAVIYYGRLETDPAQLEALQMPILGIFGALDSNPSVESVREFEAALQALGKPIEVHIYEGANHAFANPSGQNYNEEAAEAAWAETVDFLGQNLG